MNRAEPSEHVRRTVERIADAGTPLEQAEALVEVALDLQKKPKDPQELWDAIFLYDRAIDLASGDALGAARARAGKGSALRRMPHGGAEVLDEARAELNQALEVLRPHGGDDETAEVELCLGLVLQTLASAGRAPLPEAIQAYQRALRTFTRDRYPREYAVIHNNLATAYLSMRLAPEKEGMREALAVQSFQEALKVVTIDEDPVEYAMLQSNLGNALQSVKSKRRFENLQRAIEAYDEALKVRTRHDMPVEHANTIANKANALMNLPDHPDDDSGKNPVNLTEAVRLFRAAQEIFLAHGLGGQAEMVEGVLTELVADLPPEAEA